MANNAASDDAGDVWWEETRALLLPVLEQLRADAKPAPSENAELYVEPPVVAESVEIVASSDSAAITTAAAQQLGAFEKACRDAVFRHTLAVDDVVLDERVDVDVTLLTASQLVILESIQANLDEGHVCCFGFDVFPTSLNCAHQVWM